MQVREGRCQYDSEMGWTISDLYVIAGVGLNRWQREFLQVAPRPVIAVPDTRCRVSDGNIWEAV